MAAVILRPRPRRSWPQLPALETAFDHLAEPLWRKREGRGPTVNHSVRPMADSHRSLLSSYEVYALAACPWRPSELYRIVAPLFRYSGQDPSMRVGPAHVAQLGRTANSVPGVGKPEKPSTSWLFNL